MVGAALAFGAGIALGMGGTAWCGALLLVLILLRPSFPFRRPAARGALLTALVLAGAAHGAAAARGGTEALARAEAPATGRSAPAGGGAGVPPAPVARAGSEDPDPGLRERVRTALRDRVWETFPREAPMVEALVLAERRGLDPAVRSAFTRAGAAHLLAISGFHVGILAGWVFLLLRALRLGRGRAAVAGAAVVWGYVALLGFPTSAVRAGLLLSGAAAGRLRGRPVHPLGGWGLALLLVALADPAALSGAGAQLSFAGALGLILWVDPWSRAAVREVARVPGLHAVERGRGRAARGARGLAEAVAASAAAQVATLPLAVWHFQRVAVLALPATLLATPLVSLALPGALLALAAGSLGLPGWRLLAAGVEGLLWAVRVLMTRLAAWDPGWLLGPHAVALGSGAGVAAWVLTRGRLPPRLRWAWAAGAAAAAVLLAPWARGAVRSPGLEVRVLDVGQGDAIALGTPGGRWILVDTGAGSGERLARELVAAGISGLELLVLTHPDLDHMGAAGDLLRTLPVRAVADGGVVRGTEAYRDVLEAARRRRVPWRVLRRGEAWTVDGVSFTVVHPAEEDDGGVDPNDRSVVLVVRWGEFDALLTGDASTAVEAEILPLLGTVEFLKVGHHGSRTSTGDALLDRLDPDVSAISVGRGNRFGHPAPEVMARLRRKGGLVVRTDLHGAITIRAREDGSYEVETERGLEGKSPD